MPDQFDELAKALARGASRRRLLKGFAATIVGAAVATLVPGRAAQAAGNGNNVCVDFCRRQGLTGNDFGKCVAASTQCPRGECAIAVNQGAVICVPV